MPRRSNATVTDLLLAAGKGGAGLTFVEGANAQRTLSYAALADEALATLASLQALGIRAGEPVILQAGDNRTTLTLLWACLFGGMLPVPLHVGSAPEHLQKVLMVWRTLGRPWLAADTQRLAGLADYWKTARETPAPLFARTWCADAAPAALNSPRLAPGGGDAPAMLQFSSGSTGQPKGIVITHDNLIANTRAIAGRAAMSSADQLLSWVPLSHDMGMVGVHFTAALHGIPCALLPTPLFVRNPRLWLDSATALGATVLYSTNFALDFLAEVLERAPAPETWNLAAVRTLFLGAEPILAGSCRRFLRLLAPSGLRPDCLAPSYGLAEATLAVTVAAPQAALVEHRVDPASLAVGQPVAIKMAGDESSMALVACGQPVDGCRVRIEDDHGNVLPDGHLGRIVIAGSSLTPGYWGGAAARRDDGWLDSGDLGFFRDGALVVAGRRKEVMIIDGLNVYPHDLERVIGEETGLGAGTAVVCGIHPDPGGAEKIGVFVRFRGSDEDFRQLAGAIRSAVRVRCGGLPVAAVVPLRTIPRTTSGKAQRYALAQAFATGKLSEPHAAPADTLLERLQALAIDVCGPLDADRPFREQGVTSLAMAEFAVALGQRFGVALPLTRLMAMTTLREVHDALDGTAARQPTGGLVWLADGPAGEPPLFLVHPGSGAVTAYLPLAARLAAALPVAGLQAPGVRAGEEVLLSVEALADHHLATLLAAHPHGPYRLGGWSFGGVVALEIARRLAEAGHAVAPLLLFDSYLPGARVRSGGIPADPRRIDERVVAALLERAFKAVPAPSRSLGEMLAEARSRNLLQSILGGALDGAAAVRLIRCYSAALAAARRYRPTPYPGEVVLIRGAHGPVHRDPTLGWWRLVPHGLTLAWTDGDHETLVEEAHAGALSKAVLRALQR